MMIALHKNARTTPAVRAEIAASAQPASVLAQRFGITEQTVYKWKRREVGDPGAHEANGDGCAKGIETMRVGTAGDRGLDSRIGRTAGFLSVRVLLSASGRKKKCAVHLVKDHVTKEARLAVATHPLYVERFVELAQRVVVQWALVRPLQVDAAARSLVEAEIRVHDLPNELVPQVGTLVVQLRRLHPIFGEVLAGEVALLFQKLLFLATETHRRPLWRSEAEREANRQAREKIKALLTLRGFLVVWCSKGRPFPVIFPTFDAEGHDPAHPIVRDEPMVESEIARGFLRQRAWIEAEAELRRHTEIDRNDVMEMRGRGMSFDAIAAVYGCSHETIAKIAANGAAPRKRARLVGYVAKSRLRLSE